MLYLLHLFFQLWIRLRWTIRIQMEYTNKPYCIVFCTNTLPLCKLNLVFDICICVIQVFLDKGSIHIPVYKE